MNLNHIKDQEKPKEELKRYVKSNKTPHALLFYGMKGIGKFSTALAFAAYLNCKNNDPACESCSSCVKTYNMNHSDLVLIDLLPEKNEILIDQIRELKLKMRYAPLEGGYRIAIIDQAEKLNEHSTNALLKTLEEPPPNSILILVTSNIRNIRPTIISRCNLIKFNPLNSETIKQKLVQICEDSKDLDLIVKISEGSLGKAISIVDGKYSEIRNAIINWLKAKNPTEADPIKISVLLTENYSDSLEEIFDMLLLIQRDLIAIKKELPQMSLFNQDLRNILTDKAKFITLKRIVDDSRLIYLTRNAIFHNNANIKIAMDNLFLQLSYGNN